MEEDADLTYLIRSTPLRPDNARSNRRTSICQQPVDYEVVERLLSAIDRLRGERDDVKGHLEFSQVEHRFAVQAFERRILALSSATESDRSLEVSNLEEEIRRLREEANIALAKVEDSQMEARRSQLAASAFSVVVDHVRANGEYLTAQYGASLQSNEERLSDANHRASVAESQLLEVVQRYDQAEHDRQLLSSRVEELEGVIQRLSQEASESKDAYRQVGDDLEAAKATVDRLRKVVQEVETERDSLNLRIAHLEDDLSTARTEQEDLQGRYQTLQSHQLSSMSSNQASRALRQQIEELEGRVKRRTEQIGIHQHDIRRLETNLRLQEDRIAEMTADIETLTDQKEAMVEDCAEAREARDHAIQRVETLEEQVESFEERFLVAERERDARDVGVETLVKIVAQAISGKRDATTQLKSLLHFKSEQHQDAQGQLHRAQEHIRSLVQQIRELESVTASNTQDAMDVDEDPTAAIIEDLHQTTIALALSQTAYRGAVGSLSFVKSRYASAEARLSSLQQELQALGDHRSAEEDAARTQLQSHIARLESTIRGLEENLQEARSHQEQTLHQLAHAQEELRSHEERAEEQARHITGLQVKIEKLIGAQSNQAQDLQQQLEKAQTELAEAVRVRDEADAEYEKLKAEVDTTKEELNVQLKEVQELSTIRASLEKELSETRSVQAEELARLQEELSKATAATEKASAEQETISKDHRAAINELTRAKSELEEKLADVETRFAVLQQQFDEKSQAGAQSEEKLQDELRFTIERSHNAEADLYRAIGMLEANLKESSSALETVNEEKNTMEAEMTNLEAEIQRYRTLSQYLEKQVKEQETEISDLEGRLVALRKDYATLEQESSGVELQLSLKDAQHREALAALQRELDALCEKPSLEARLQELQERYDEMEEDLKEKCAEIERTDDKYLVVLKERKKLNFQVDSLTRKVKALENELANATSKQTSKTKEPSTLQLSTQAPVPSRSTSTSSRKSTTTNTSQPSSRSSSSRTSAVSSTDSPHLLQNARPLASMSASNSGLHRTKAPEPKVRHEVKPVPAATVQVQQPEPVTIGKKRRAPDDFDACESIPTQVFTSESVPSKASESQTPRSRKTTTGNRGGFTPVRSRPPSKDPVGRIAAPALTSTAAITDVTNGTAQRPVTQPAPPTIQAAQPPAKARSWLRNVKPPVVSR
ncbi:hypothetical protein BDM02DRAFT_3106652 [Thelephora ganbajun]|uniref:Uncharacterized protein n=1 Tax=Thelephora ganbajun TaxID=370292 RepID=A0ACB6ZWW9_THEGA|nr:hypothetical protein BDM02DRAFT_3106652 [Thelephora ganbajun]